ncbi:MULTISPECIES: hypothetical protein [Prauserella salsuginis group]|uniref:Uncharacterized protein n=1 Tax=Prauserella salsuginis TaxID=387889 RepID=A0ABW6G346_9PSEU|nr:MULTISPECIES: hypothetical protein [Prauserella salsuginis group]
MPDTSRAGQLPGLAGPPGGPVERRATGRAATAAVMLVLTPLHGLALLVALLAMESWDASGRGVPFRACTADSVSCTGPNLPMIAGGILVVLSCVAVAVHAGMRTGRLPPRWRHRGFLACIAAPAAALGDTVAALLLW